jgi:hypothetical protein
MKTAFRLLSTATTLLAASAASAVTIQDNYWGAQPGIYSSSTNSASPYPGYANRDVIEDPTTTAFDIQNMNVSQVGNNLVVTISTNYSGGIDGTTYGDLFLSTTGWHPDTTVWSGCNATAAQALSNYACDNLSHTGTQWNFAVDSNGNLYSVNNSNILTTDQVYGSANPNNWIYRSGQATGIRGGTLISTGSADFSHAGPGGYVSYTIDLNSLGSFSDLGLSWNMTCGNDTIQGDYSVPEPGTMGLLGLGLLGAGFAMRRRPVRA